MLRCHRVPLHLAIVPVEFIILLRSIRPPETRRCADILKPSTLSESLGVRRVRNGSHG